MKRIFWLDLIDDEAVSFLGLFWFDVVVWSLFVEARRWEYLGFSYFFIVVQWKKKKTKRGISLVVWRYVDGGLTGGCLKGFGT